MTGVITIKAKGNQDAFYQMLDAIAEEESIRTMEFKIDISENEPSFYLVLEYYMVNSDFQLEHAAGLQ